MSTDLNVNKNEIKRYLGYQGVKEYSPEIEEAIDECLEEMKKVVSPRYVYKRFPIIWLDDGDSHVLEFSGVKIKEGSLTANVRGCTDIVMLAVTLGPEPDRLVKRAGLRQSFKAMVYQATGAAMVEAWCDEINEKIIAEAQEDGLYARPRFSPGYGNFPLETQKDFERILMMHKKIGVSLSESLLMTPTKSVTAVIGLSKEKLPCIKSGCEICLKNDTCEYSRK